MSDNFCYKTSAIWQFVGYAVYALKLVIPAIIIVLAIVDFSKAVVSSDDKAISSAAMSLARRALLGIVIFFIPSIVRVVSTFVGEMADAMDLVEGCTECLLDPTGTTCATNVENSTAELKSSS